MRPQEDSLTELLKILDIWQTLLQLCIAFCAMEVSSCSGLVRSTSHLGVSVSLLSKCGTRIGERLASGSREKQAESTTSNTLTIIC